MSNRKFKGVWIPKEVWLCEDLNFTQKGLLVEIDSLDNGDDGCIARNKYFADFFGYTAAAISKNIKVLEEKGYVKKEIVYFKDSAQVQKRHLHVIKFPGETRGLTEKDWRAKRNKNPQEINQDTPLTLVNHPLVVGKSPSQTLFKDNNTCSINTLLDYLQKKLFEISDKDKRIEELEELLKGESMEDKSPPIQIPNSLDEERVEKIARAMTEKTDFKSLKPKVKKVVDAEIKKRNELWVNYFRGGKDRKIGDIVRHLIESNFFYEHDGGLKSYIQQYLSGESKKEDLPPIDEDMQKMIEWCVNEMNTAPNSFPEPKAHELNRLMKWIEDRKSDGCNHISILFRCLISIFHQSETEEKYKKLGFAVTNFWEDRRTWIEEQGRMMAMEMRERAKNK